MPKMCGMVQKNVRHGAKGVQHGAKNLLHGAKNVRYGAKKCITVPKNKALW